MSTLEFVTVVHDGLIRVPAAIRQRTNAKKVKVSLHLPSELKKKPAERTLLGNLSKYGNARKRQRERTAWTIAAKAKHADR
ncbi:hypothetical protein FBQ87_11815 [Sphingobacteriales bacterium CHB3]|nr:hypothetical protein [Sphingobacteriales bacterium CHB3]